MDSTQQVMVVDEVDTDRARRVRILAKEIVERHRTLLITAIENSPRHRAAALDRLERDLFCLEEFWYQAGQRARRCRLAELEAKLGC
jgi:hypothetical protein